MKLSTTILSSLLAIGTSTAAIADPVYRDRDYRPSEYGRQGEYDRRDGRDYGPSYDRRGNDYGRRGAPRDMAFPRLDRAAQFSVYDGWIGSVRGVRGYVELTQPTRIELGR